MQGLALLHLSTALLWASAATYLPKVMAIAVGDADRSGQTSRAALAGKRRVWMLYLAVTTPAAFVAILSGIALHDQQPWAAPWPLVHLVIVGVLVWAHGASGFLILKLERHQHRGLLKACRLVTGTTLLFLLAFASFGKMASTG